MKTVKLSFVKTVLKAGLIYKVELLFSFAFTVILTVGYFLTKYDTIDVTPISERIILADFFGALVIWCVMFLGFVRIRRWTLHRTGTPNVAAYLEDLSDKKMWLLTSLAIFICYLPLLVASLSMLSPDSWNSVRQMVGMAPLNNANPLIFTAFVGIFISIGRLFGSIELGTVLFSFAQSAILAMIFAKVIVWMRREKVGKAGIIATFLFYAVLPINAIAGIIMWKDILFAGFGLLFLILLRQLYIEKDAFFSPKKIIYFIILAFLFCVWRNNGSYAYDLFVILAIIINYKTFFKKNYLLLLLAPVVISFIYSYAVNTLTSTSGSVKVSIPMQQFARTVKYESTSLSNEDKKTINEFLPYDKLGEEYNPRLSDPVMASFNDKIFDKNEHKYLNLWFKLFRSHKKTYVAAFLYNNYGYAYPFYLSSTPTDILLDNASHPNAIKGYTDGGYTDGGKFIVVEYRDFIMKPVSFLQNVGFYTCLLLFGAYIAIIRKRRELTGVFILLLGLFISTILGPVNSEFRYLYLFVIATPLVIVSVFSNYSFMKGKRRRD